MVPEIQHREINTHNERVEVEKLQLLLNITLPSVEVEWMTGYPHGYRGRHPTSLEMNEWIPALALTAKIIADKQNDLGEKLGYYPRGYMSEGSFYTYKPGEEKLTGRPYKMKEIPSPDELISKLFPKSSPMRDFLEVIPSRDREGDLDPKNAAAAAEIIFKIYTGRENVGPITVQRHHALPVIKCSDREDFSLLRPYIKRDLPNGTQGYSYVSSRFTRPIKKDSKFIGTPIAVCMQECPRRTAEKLIDTQLIYAHAVGRNKNYESPVLVSKSSDLLVKEPGMGRSEFLRHKLGEEMRYRLKKHLLALIIEEKEPVEWAKVVVREQIINDAQREVFTNEDSHLYLGDKLSLSSVLGGSVQEEIRGSVAQSLEEAMKIVSRLNISYRSRETQLVIANLLSFFPLTEWKNVELLFSDWKYKEKFLRSFGIPSRGTGRL